MRKGFETVDKAFRKISSVCVVISATVLFLVVALIFVDVFMRYVFRYAIKGQQELAEWGTVIVVYFGLPFATRVRSHVRVEPITGMFSPRVRSYLYGALDFLITIFMAVLSVKVFQQAVNLTATPGNATLILRLPSYIIYFIAGVGASISTVEFLLDGIRYILEGNDARHGEKMPEGGEG